MENIAKRWFQEIKRRTENIVGISLTDDELKSIDESDKLESGEDRNILLRAYLGVIILTVLLSLELYHDINLFGVTTFLCLSTITLQIIHKHYIYPT